MEEKIKKNKKKPLSKKKDGERTVCMQWDKAGYT